MAPRFPRPACTGLVLALLLSTSPSLAAPQAPEGTGVPRARITEEVRTLATYPFSEPNPIPILTRDRRLYPYHSFEGYTDTPEPREWKVVKLENDLVEVFVLPEVGGKVWGAVVKATGHEFIYRNEVMKFRNIALRGPWTSGGIEFNFGVIGHTPSTATPVAYLLEENADGSVSCWVGATDLPSRTVWRVEIRLPPDEAVFETNVFWYNPTPLEQPYYNWMTAAAFARTDLEMSMPGNAYLQHSGQVESWPLDEEGRYLPLYAENTFGGHKSYHVVGELKDFFGGYYLLDGWGFGHWARYEEMPGQKLWLWALSREGGVWEDLLTDTDGQYVEFQAGRLFVQYSPGPDVNPITQAGFDPLSASRWTERWFPVEGIGGLTEASAHGALYTAAEAGRLSIGVNAFRDARDTLKVWSEDRLIHQEALTLDALEPFRTELVVTSGAPFRVQLAGLGLDYTSDPSGRTLSRPFITPLEAWASVPDADRRVFQARELMKGRRYPEARALFESVLEREPWNREGLLGLAEISYRRGLYETGLGAVHRALGLDAYDAQANFLAGALYRALGRNVDAIEAFGWAARSTAYRSAAYVQLAEMAVLRGDWAETARYAELALDFDRSSIPARQALAIAGRKTESREVADRALEGILALDPLSSFALGERLLTAANEESVRRFFSSLSGEFPEEEKLELAITYWRLGLREEAARFLEIQPAAGLAWDPGSVPGIVSRAWLAWLRDDPQLVSATGDLALAFPHRPETLPVLEWAVRANGERRGGQGDWGWRYLLGLNLWALDRDEEAAEIFEELGNTPDFAPFYAARASLLEDVRGTDPETDLRKAVEVDPESRILHVLLVQHLQEVGHWEDALAATTEASERFPGDFNLSLLRAKSLIHLGRPQEAISILAATRVLPSENARESHRLWEQAHIMAALDAADAQAWSRAREHLQAAMTWPENLGQGRPYQPEERLARFILGEVELRLENPDGAQEAFQAVVEGTPGMEPALAGVPPDRPLSRLDLLALPALETLGRGADAERLWAAWSRETRRVLDETQLDLDTRLFRRAVALRGIGE